MKKNLKLKISWYCPFNPKINLSEDEKAKNPCLIRRELEDGDGGEHLASGGQLRGDTLHTPLRRQASGPTIETGRQRERDREKEKQSRLCDVLI
jgi:hypothetical protein